MSYTIEQLRALVEHDKQEEIQRTPKVLIFDIETTPMISYHWKRFKENISLDQTIQESFMLCWSAKWLYSDEVFGECLTPEEIKHKDDIRIVDALWRAVDSADIIIAYNGKSFDIPYMNQRFLVNGLDPYSPVQVIDPIETLKSQFRFSSNKMDHIATELGLSNKLDTDFNLWRECMEGNKKALDRMFTYNMQDVKVLEEIFLVIRPWLKKYPNIRNYTEGLCMYCGESSITKLNKFYYTPSGKYEVFRCNDCGAIFRGKKNLLKSKNPFVECR